MEKELLKQLVEIPSYLDQKIGFSERKLSVFIKNFFEQNFPNYKIYNFNVENERGNLLIIPKNPKIIFCCHLDTVLPSKKNHTKIISKGDKLYGLGTKDMKGGTVSSVSAMLELPKNEQEKVGFLFYCDEEYEQKGMELMVKKSNLIPKSVEYFLSPESRFNISYGCRGYACVNLIIRGKRASTARASQGINAGEVFFNVYNELKKDFSKIKTELGKSVTVLTDLRVGLLVNGEYKRQDNAVPDYAEGNIAIRLSKNFSNKEILKIFEDKIRRKLGKLPFSIKLNSLRQPSIVLPKKTLKIFLQSAEDLGFKIELSDPGSSGYNDVAMISAKTGIPFFNFGPYGEGNHGPDEWVSLKSIKDTKNIFKNFIRNL